MLSLFEQLDDIVAEVFSVMLDRECAPAAATGSPHADDLLSAWVLFSGSLEGTCAVHVESQCAGELAEQLMGAALEPGSDLPADTVGEICNMIAGSWKSRLAPEMAVCTLSAPTVATGLRHGERSASLSRFYRFAEHTFMLEMTIP